MDKQPRSFVAWLADQRAGQTQQEMTDALAEVVAAALEHGKAGEVVLTLRVKKMAAGVVEVADTIRVKVPEGERGASLFYADEAAGLYRENPYQQRLPLHEVTRPTPKEVVS